MITIAQQPPSFHPAVKSHPLEWRLSTDEHIAVYGQAAAFTISITGPGAAGDNGKVITIAGVDFTIDNSTPHTSTTFQYTGTAQEIADNIANMLRANYSFADYAIYITSSGGTFTVNALNHYFKVQPNYTFDYANLVTAFAGNTETAGIDIELNNYRIWYQLWYGTTPVMVRKFTDMPHSQSTAGLTADLDLVAEASRQVSSRFPSWDLSAPEKEPAYLVPLTLRYGGVLKDSAGDVTYTEAYESQAITMANCVLQIRDVLQFKAHTPGFVALVEWLTDRPNGHTIPFDSYEWANIYIANTPDFAFETDGFRVVYTFYYSLSASTSSEQLISQAGDVFTVPTGTANPSLVNFITSDCTHYEIVIQGKKPGDIWEDFSTVLERKVNHRPQCCQEEIYFLENKGSFGTICFRELTQKIIDVQGIEIETPLDYSTGAADLYPTGGKQSVVTKVQKKCTVISNKLRRCDEVAAWFEQLLHSPEVYLRTTKRGVSEGIQTRRRIVIDRGRSTIYDKANGVRLLLSYQFTTNHNSH